MPYTIGHQAGRDSKGDKTAWVLKDKNGKVVSHHKSKAAAEAARRARYANEPKK